VFSVCGKEEHHGGEHMVEESYSFVCSQKEEREGMGLGIKYTLQGLDI
jgi:hypothetical protein